MANPKMYCWYPIIKMVSFAFVLHLFGSYLLLKVTAQAAVGTSVIASFYENPIVEGREAMLHCDVPVPPSEYVLDILFTSKFVVRHDEVQPVPGMEMSLSSDGNTLILKIAKLKREHSGMYTCKVMVPAMAGAWRTVGTSSSYLDVQYFPDPPQCRLQGMFSGLFIKNGDNIRATCTTNPGNPAVSIQWTKTLTSGATSAVSGTDGMSSSSIFSRLETVFLSHENNVVYTCTVTSPAFPDARDNTCTVGPFLTLPTQPPKEAEVIEDTTFAIPTSDGPEVRIGANPEMGTSAIVGIVAVLLVVTLATFLFLLVRFRKVSQGKPFQKAVPSTKPSSPSSKPEIKRKSKFKSFTAFAEVMPPKKVKFYPPPPAYPTATQQIELNQKYLLSSQEMNKLEDVVSVTSWGDVLDPPSQTNCGDQFASDGDGLVEPIYKNTRTDGFKRMFGGGGNFGDNRKPSAVYADVIKPVHSRDRAISTCSNSPLYVSIDHMS